MRALIVEDHETTRTLLAATLRDRDHDIQSYPDAEAAWDAFGIGPESPIFDLAIVDIGLPGQDGIAFCRQFRRHPAGRHAIILLVTADERSETLEAALDAGAHDYIIKPIDRRLLGVRLAIAEQRSLASATSRYSREALRESEHRFEAFMNNSPAVAFIKDARGRFLYVNRRYLEVFAITEGDVIGRTHDEVYPPDVAAGMRQSDDDVLRAGAARESLENVPLADGMHQWLVYRFPLADHQGRHVLIAGIAIDITDRVRAEEALKESGERLRLVFESTRDGLWEWNPADGSVQWSDRVFEMLGLTRTAFTPSFERLLDLVHPEDRAALLEGVRAHYNERAPFHVQTRMRRGDGSYAYTESRGQAVFDAVGGHATRMVGSITDVTARVEAEAEHARLEEQMRSAQKMESLGVLTGGIAHDFNNLLVGILGNASLALLELPDDAPARQAIRDIEVSAQRAAELTRQMLAYSGRGRFVVEPADLSHLVEEMSQLLRRVISKQGQLDLRLGQQLPAVVADSTQLRQVVMNLITNASDALNMQPGTIVLETGVVEADRAMLSSRYLNEELTPGHYVYLEVSDTGIGMDVATLPRIFEPFFTTKFTGRGLGLAAVLGIVRGHRGAIHVRSDPGVGTTFRILLPATLNAQATAPKFPAAATWHGSGRVLLVDDEEAVRGVARRVLERSGFQVEEAENGEEALAMCATGAVPSIVVLDLTMPGLGGEATFRELQRRHPTLPVIVSSGYMPDEDGAMAHVPFLAKPYRPAELLDAVREALAKGDGGIGE